MERKKPMETYAAADCHRNELKRTEMMRRRCGDEAELNEAHQIDDCLTANLKERATDG